jgi:hypothetical protein
MTLKDTVYSNTNLQSAAIRIVVSIKLQAHYLVVITINTRSALEATPTRHPRNRINDS